MSLGDAKVLKVGVRKITENIDFFKTGQTALLQRVCQQNEGVVVFKTMHQLQLLET